MVNLLEELVKRGFVNKSRVGEIRNRATNEFDGDIYRAALESGIPEEEILKTIGEYFTIPVSKIRAEEVSFDVLKYIPENAALHYGFVPLRLSDGVLEVGVTNPEDIQAMDALQFISVKLSIPFKIFLISKEVYKTILRNYGGVFNEVGKEIDKLKESEGKEKDQKSNGNGSDVGDWSLNKETETTESLGKSKIVEDAPVIKIVAVILRNAIEGNASDIHIEPEEEKNVRVRYRVDGVLNTTILFPSSIHDGIIARIKILSKLRLDEKRKPQDGSFSANINDRKVDFRVSTMPTYYGEKVAIRILDPEKSFKSLDQLGLSKMNLKTIREALGRSYGLILLTGPTGSGKTTTLYSMINELDKEKSNIVSLEDPVEYTIPKINQSQVMPEIGYSFASGLRSILRQDPDIIMVGEIRDKETAQLAIQAALTGHLVFSTLHTNSAIGAIPRLVDMGIDPYLIAPTLILSIAQRLVRMTCPDSKKLIPMDNSIKIQIEKQFEDLPEEFRKEIEIKDQMYEITPSPECPSGTRGRVAVFEILKIDSKIQEVILKNPIDSEIYKVARNDGMLTMREDAIVKAVNGIVPFTEVYDLNNKS
jgi:type IV pilus assembly protein PilB